MNKKKLVAEVLRLAPEFSLIDNIYYEEPVGHILCGFLCEIRADNARFWQYVMPLYDRLRSLHLGFSEPFAGGDRILQIQHRSERDIAQEFFNRLQHYRAHVASLSELDRFAEFIRPRINYRTPGYRRAYALTLILLGQAKEAEIELRTVSELEGLKEDPEAVQEVAVLLRDLSTGINIAQETVLEWEQETKQKLGLPTSQ